LTHYLFFLFYLLTRIFYAQDPYAGGSGDTSAMSNFSNDSSMPSMPFKDGCASTPYIREGFTDLLLGVHQDAAISSSARKFYFDENI